MNEAGIIKLIKSKYQPPAEFFRKVESVLTKSDGSTVKTTIEFFKDTID